MSTNILTIVEDIHILLAIVQNTSTATQYYKLLHFLDTREVFNCMLTLQTIAANLKNVLDLLEQHTNVDEGSCAIAVADLAKELLATVKVCGTYNLEDLLYLLLEETPTNVCGKYILLHQFAHPISCTELPYSAYTHLTCTNVMGTNAIGPNVIGTNVMGTNAIGTNAIGTNANAVDTVDTNTTLAHKAFNYQVHCIKLFFHANDKCFIITCLIDDIHLDILQNDYITTKLNNLSANAIGANAIGANAIGANAIDPTTYAPIQWYDYLQTPLFLTYKSCLSLKDLLIYSELDVHHNYLAYMHTISRLSEQSISQVVDNFLTKDLYHKRLYLMDLLMNVGDQEAQYLAYLLYDLLSNDLNGTIDTVEQTLLFDSFPFKIKHLFHNAMRETVNYTKKLSNTDLTNIPLEQRICLLKTPDAVKEKAMVKLKEIKAKGDDSGAKPRHYLEGLLKIPFHVLKVEPILKINEECIQLFTQLFGPTQFGPTQFGPTQFGPTQFGPTQLAGVCAIPQKTRYNSVEVQRYIHVLRTQGLPALRADVYQRVAELITGSNRKKLVALINAININAININAINNNTTTTSPKIKLLQKTLPQLRAELLQVVQHWATHPQEQDVALFGALSADLHQRIGAYTQVFTGIQTITNKCVERNQAFRQITQTLDAAVYGHATAKRQLERIIGQWINGENSGYCFGFEGPPGVGKTSLAKKGIAECLKDAGGQSRPFAFIAIGGSANGSTLEGHNYTYVGSTWGKVVEILMEKKCMNPIIFIDELDKVSKTEHGKEIISILTHLVDPSQNDTFQDKYFSGIDIDVSNILFVFSYNDAQLIDKILLDRIHRIKFEHLSLAEKVVIAQQFILPDIYKKMGLTDVLVMDAAEIEFIIEEYTAESGVRKLKELLFDIVGEINLELLTSTDTGPDIGIGNHFGAPLPLKITKQALVEKYLKDRSAVRIATVPPVSRVGCINGLWANALGKGGVLPIEANYYPAGTFLDLRLTGMQGDVMKESMSVAKTLAWSLLTTEQQQVLDAKQGIHIHVPEGATPKDGPSAGTAITVVMYSLFTGQKIKHDVAITGEICLSGRVTAIGGLDLKILGGIKAGVKTFLFPTENLKDFEKIQQKYGAQPFFPLITFLPVADIKEVLQYTF